jgi:hypothetical protein
MREIINNMEDLQSEISDVEREIKNIRTPIETEEKERKNELAKINPSTKTSVLLDRAFILLEDGKWNRADDLFEYILINREPKNARAYIGKLCAELEITTESQLANNNEPLHDMSLYQKAVKFADDDYRATLEGYNKKIKARIAERIRQAKIKEEHAKIKAEQEAENKRLNQYNSLVQQMDVAEERNCYATFRNLVKKFRDMNGYKDTAELAERCEVKYESRPDEHKKMERYRSLTIQMMGDPTETEYRDMAKAFDELGNYKDSPAKAESCRALEQSARDTAAMKKAKMEEAARKSVIKRGYTEEEFQKAYEIERQRFISARHGLSLACVQRLEAPSNSGKFMSKREHRKRVMTRIGAFIGVLVVVFIILRYFL